MLSRGPLDLCLLTWMTLGSKSGGKPSRKHISSQSHYGQLSSRTTKAYISSGKGAISGSSSSHCIHHTFSGLTSARTRLSSIKETLTSSEIQTRQLRITRSTKKGWIPWQQQSVATSKLSCMMTLTSQQWTLWIFSPERTRWILAMLEESLLTSSPLVMTFLDLLGTFLCLLCYTKTKTHYNKSASYSWLSNSSKSNTASYRGLFTAAAFVG